MSTFFGEVKRRKVYRVAVAYVVAAGGIIQLASATFPAWDLPNWSLRLVITLLLIGFPIALIFAWAFDLTAEGIQRTPRAVTAPPGRTRRNMVLLCLVALAISGVAGFFLLPRASAGKLDKSIAVLPFESLSDDKENAFFADGIQDDILTNLAKIGDLKVISRTSVMPYRGKRSNVREIGKALGVTAVLEGSVRKDGNRVRVNVQLINAENDQHIWAEDYDRDLTDIFAIQTDLAQKIATELRAKLSPSEKAQIMRKPTESGEAYLAFVEARNLYVPEDPQKLKQAGQLFERAIQLDPHFALAYAEYSHVESWIFHTFDPAQARREKAQSLAERALQLQPELPEAHLARGFVYYYGDQDLAAALREFEMAQSGLPNESGVYLALGAIQRRQGRWDESTANLEKAVSLNPRATWPLQNLFFNYEMRRDFARANKTLEQALALDPNSLPLLDLKAKLALLERGDLEAGARMLERIGQLSQNTAARLKLAETEIRALFCLRKFPEALRVAERLPDEKLSEFTGALGAKYYEIGELKLRLGDEAGGKAALRKSREITEGDLKTSPTDARWPSQLALIAALLGDKESAITQAERAMQLVPESKDAFSGPDVTQTAAAVFAKVGERERAFALLDGLLSRPSLVTVPYLKVDPTWDEVRDDPRFQALLTKYGARS